MRACTLVIGIVALAVCTSCGRVREAAGTIGELQQVQQAVSKAAGTSNVNINLVNGNSLVIGLVNTPLKDLSVDQKKTKALELAQLGYRSYPQTAKLDQVSVVFVVQRSYLGVLNYTDTSDTFSFVASDLSNAKSSGEEHAAR